MNFDFFGDFKHFIKNLRITLCSNNTNGGNIKVGSINIGDNSSFQQNVYCNGEAAPKIKLTDDEQRALRIFTRCKGGRYACNESGIVEQVDWVELSDPQDKDAFVPSDPDFLKIIGKLLSYGLIYQDSQSSCYKCTGKGRDFILTQTKR